MILLSSSQWKNCLQESTRLQYILQVDCAARPKENADSYIYLKLHSMFNWLHLNQKAIHILILFEPKIVIILRRRICAPSGKCYQMINDQVTFDGRKDIDSAISTVFKSIRTSLRFSTNPAWFKFISVLSPAWKYPSPTNIDHPHLDESQKGTMASIEDAVQKAGEEGWAIEIDVAINVLS